MDSKDRQGSISFILLLAGVFFVLLIAAGAMMSKQAKASARLEGELQKAQYQMAERGIAFENSAKADKGVKIDEKKVTPYEGTGYSLNIPKNFKIVERDNGVTEFLSDDRYAGNVLVPRGHVKVAIQPNIRLAVSDASDLDKLEPYADASKIRKTVVNGLPARIYVNDYNQKMRWYTVYISQRVDGNYTKITAQSADSPQVYDVLFRIVLPSLRLKDGR